MKFTHRGKQWLLSEDPQNPQILLVKFKNIVSFLHILLLHKYIMEKFSPYWPHLHLASYLTP